MSFLSMSAAKKKPKKEISRKGIKRSETRSKARSQHVLKKLGNAKSSSVNKVKTKKPIISKQNTISSRTVTGNSYIRWHILVSVLTILLLLPGVVTLFSEKSTWIDDIQGSLFSLQDLQKASSVSPSSNAKNGAILLVRDIEGVNESKLYDIFQTVFPDLSIERIDYRSLQGKALIKELAVSEVPDIFFDRTTFESEHLSAIVSDLFTLKGDYYTLEVSLVNPSGQLRINGPPKALRAVHVGQVEAPLSMYLYSEVSCQQCRANERNNLSEFQKLIDEGLLQMIFLDMPSDKNSIFQANALTCYHEKSQNDGEYLILRNKIYSRPNLTKAFTNRELRRLGVDYNQDCNIEEFESLYKTRAQDSDDDGVTVLPTAYIGMSGGQEFLRFSGSHTFVEYQAIFDGLLKTGE